MGVSRLVSQIALASHKIFIVVNVVGLATVVLASWMLVMALARVGVPGAACEGAAHLGGIGVGAAVNFFGHRHITFS